MTGKRDINDLVFKEPEVRFMWSVFTSSGNTVEWFEEASNITRTAMYHWFHHKDRPKTLADIKLKDIKKLLGILGYELVIQPKKTKR